MTRPKHILSGFSLAYSLFIILWLCLRWWLFDRVWSLAILNTVIFYFFLPVPVLFLAAIYQRQKWATMALVIPIGVFLFFWGGFFWPPPAAPGGNASPAIQAMSYNVLYSNQTPGALVGSIQAASPDIIGFQELTLPLIAAVQSDLLAAYPYHAFDLFDPHGVGLLSRYPILEASGYTMPPGERRVLYAVVDWQGQPVHVFVVHLSANNFFDNPFSELPRLASERYQHRSNQVAFLAEQLRKLTGPVILLCDCNFTDSSEAYSQLARQLNDSYRVAGWGLGHTLHPPGMPFPVQRIDYVWHSHHFIPTHSVVGLAGGSDHRPVISTLLYAGKEE